MNNIIYSKCLHVRDKKGKLAALLFTHMPDTIPEIWDHILELISVLYGGEFFVDKSNRIGYDFCAIHYHCYNRYSENVSAVSQFL